MARTSTETVDGNDVPELADQKLARKSTPAFADPSHRTTSAGHCPKRKAGKTHSMVTVDGETRCAFCGAKAEK